MQKTTSIAAAVPLSADQRRALRCLAGIIIPASREYAVPGADDDAIFADILSSLNPATGGVSEALQHLDVLSGGAFADLGAAEQQAVAMTFRNTQSSLLVSLINLLVQCYYRDDRVMRSLGMEPRPPYPLGFEVESGDWSLLDPVRARGKIYRDAP